MTKQCPCCDTSFTSGTGFTADVYSDGQSLEYCSAECAVALSDAHEDYLNSYDIED